MHKESISESSALGLNRLIAHPNGEFVTDPAPAFSVCDREPIHLIGGIQPHGALIATDSASLTITHASANCGTILGIPPSKLIGMDLEALLGKRQMAMFASLVRHPMDPDIYKPWPCEVRRPKGPGLPFMALAHDYNGKTIIEFFKQQGEDVNPTLITRQRHDILDAIRGCRDVKDLCAAVVQTIRQFTGFDRAMIYRFHPDMHGEVIAEDTDLPERYLHLHYPASDIPAQARAAYTRNLSRCICDVNASAVAIEPLSDAQSDVPLDLTFAKLRAVSPVHLDYMRNMGTAASMSISIIVDGGLWGLIACHHQTPHFVPSEVLAFSELIGKIVAAQIINLQMNEKLARLVETESIVNTLNREQPGNAVALSIDRAAPKICDLLEATGLIGRIGGKRVAHNASAELNADGLARRTIHKSHATPLIDIKDEIIRAQDNPDECRGGIYLPLADDGSDYMLVFRNAYASTVKWAGDPTTKVSRTNPDGSQRLGPRESFAIWTETVEGQCASFDKDFVDVAERLRQVIVARQALEREAQARLAMEAVTAQRDQLRQQLVQGSRLMAMAEMASSISHELNQPLTAVINFAETCRLLLDSPNEDFNRESARSLVENMVSQSRRAGEIVHRMRALAKRKRADMDPFDIVSLLKETVNLSVPISQSDQISVSWSIERNLPMVLADQLQISQVIFNLVRNAAEALQSAREKRIRINVRCDGNDMVAVRIADTGDGIDPSVRERLFDPFVSTKEMGMGLGLALSLSIIEANAGHLSVDANEEDTCFLFTLPIYEEKSHPA